jgi:hypothetical protein
MQEHMLGTTLACILFAVVYAMVQRKRQRAGRAALSRPAGSNQAE